METKLHPWQEQIFDKITSGGFKPGEMMIMMSGRQVGKSFWTNQAIKRLMDDLNSNPVSEITLGEGTVYGSRYYTAAPIGGNWLEMEKWCSITFGEGCRALWGEKKAPEPARRWYANNRKFWFRSEKDRTLFIIRWSSL